MKLKSSRTPGLVEALRASIYNAQLDVHTALPGKVEKYHVDQQKVDVKPLLKRTFFSGDGEEISETLPVIREVPVVFPRAGGFFISLPIQVGDHVLLVFNERSIDRFVSGDGADTDPVDLRMHDISDAVAFPGFYPFKKPIIDANDKDLVIGKDEDGMQIKVTAEDTVEITLGGENTVTLTDKDAGATLELGNGAMQAVIHKYLKELYDDVKTAYDNHTHATGMGPSGKPIPPPYNVLPTWGTNIASTKLTFPDNG